MKKDIEYEKLTQEIYQNLINAQGIKIIDVKHNVKIEGKSGQVHQIDVYWEYEIAEVRHKVAIECKNYNKRVAIGKMRDFYSVLADIGGVNGIMVSKKGFQRGSIEFSKHYGINLRELREAKKEDWQDGEWLLGECISINFQANKIAVLVDKHWAKENIKLSQDDSIRFTIKNGKLRERWIVNKDGQKMNDLEQLLKELPGNDKEEKNLEHIYKFEDAYTESDNFGLVKITAIQYFYEVFTETVFEITEGDFTKAILKDVLSGEIRFFDENGKPK